jgi:hypothetical protein
MTRIILNSIVLIVFVSNLQRANAVSWSDVVSSDIALLCETDVCSETLYNKCPSHIAIEFKDNHSQEINDNALKLTIIKEKIRQSEGWPYQISEYQDYYYSPKPGRIDIFKMSYNNTRSYLIRINRETLNGTIRYSKKNTSILDFVSRDYDYGSSNLRGEASLLCKIEPDARKIIYKIVEERETERREKQRYKNMIEADKKRDDYRARALAEEERQKAEAERQREIDKEINEKRNKRQF